MMVDLLAWRAAAAVVGNYHFALSAQLAAAVPLKAFLTALTVALDEAGGCRLSHSLISRSRLVKVSAAFVKSALLGLWFWKIDLVHMGYLIWDWRPMRTYYRYGLGVTFLMSGQLMIIREPERYSTQAAEKVLVSASEEGMQTVENSLSPSVLIVMNESFSDLRLVGPLRCTAEHLAFFRSLRNDGGTLEFGRAYVSAFGAQTCNSEFELLTGASMYMLPTSASYKQYDFYDIASLVPSMNAQGYETIAVHPENPTNWRRNVVYDGMRFGRFLSYLDFPPGTANIFGTRISDGGNYTKVTELLERAEKPVFIHKVTMQNHGAYNIRFLRGRKLAKVDAAYARYSDLVAYETLVRELDRALRKLISWCKAQDKPVIICFFGDHQPKLNGEFSSLLLNSGKRGGEVSLKCSSARSWSRISYGQI